jgi:hypothetical protein
LFASSLCLLGADLCVGLSIAFILRFFLQIININRQPLGDAGQNLAKGEGFLLLSPEQMLGRKKWPYQSGFAAQPAPSPAIAWFSILGGAAFWWIAACSRGRKP